LITINASEETMRLVRLKNQENDPDRLGNLFWESERVKAIGEEGETNYKRANLRIAGDIAALNVLAKKIGLQGQFRVPLLFKTSR
jgi:hypothetical protein